jgi:hypothetical protein
MDKETYDLLDQIAETVETDDHLAAGMDPRWLIDRANEILLPGALVGDVFQISCEVVTDRYGW